MLPPGDSFYIRVRGRTSGPFTRAQLRRMHEQGQLSAFHEMSDDGQRWALASDLGFGSGGSGPPPLPGGGPAPMPAGPMGMGGGMPPVGSQAPQQRWFVLDDDDQQHGPMTREQLAQLAQQGAIPKSHLIWCEGWPNWIPLGESDLAPAPVYRTAPQPAQPQAYLMTPAAVQAPAVPAPVMPRQQPAPAAPMPQPAPRARPAPQPTPRPEPAADGAAVSFIWTLGIFLGLFLILLGFVSLGLATYDLLDTWQRDAASLAEFRKVDKDAGSGTSERPDISPPKTSDRFLTYMFFAGGLFFVAVGVSVLLVSINKRKQALAGSGPGHRLEGRVG